MQDPFGFTGEYYPLTLTWTGAAVMILIAAALAAIVIRFRPAPDEWTPARPFFRKTLIDGSKASGPMMYRRLNGGEYRHMTPDEEADELASSSW